MLPPNDFLAQLARLSQRSSDLSWSHLLDEALTLLAEAIGASRSALALLDAHQRPLLCIHRGAPLPLCAALRQLPGAALEQYLSRTALRPVTLPPIEPPVYLLLCPPAASKAFIVLAFVPDHSAPEFAMLEQVLALLTPLLHNALLQWQSLQRAHTPASAGQRMLQRNLAGALAIIQDLSELPNLALLLQEGEVLHLVAGVGQLQALEGCRYAVGQTIYPQLTIGHPRVWRDITPRSHSRMTLLKDSTWVIGAPVVEEDVALGMLVAEGTAATLSHPNAPAHLLQLGQSFPAILRIHRQAEQNREWARRYRILANTIQEINALHDLDATMEQLCRAALGMLDADRCAIRYRANGGDEGEYQVGDPALLAFLEMLSRHHAPALLADAWDMPEEIARLAQEQGLRSVLRLDLKTSERQVGALLLARTQLRSFSEEELNLGSTLVGQAALALNNAYLYQQERAQRQLAEALGEAATALNATLDLEYILDQILEQVQRVVPSDASNVMLIENNEAYCVRWRGYAQFGVEERFATLRYPLSLNNFQLMLETLTPQFIQDTRQDPRWVAMPGLEWLRAYIAAPIVIDDAVVGFINLDSAQPNYFKEQDIQHLQVFAGYAALAFQNAAHYQESQQREARQQAVNSVIAAVNSELDLDAILRIGLTSALEIADMERGALYLWDPADNFLHLRVSQGLTPEDIERVKKHRPGEGLTGKAFAEQLFVVADNLRAYLPGINTALLDYLKMQVSMPLISEGKAVGVISMNRPRTGHFSPEAQALLQTITGQLVIAIQRGQLAQQLRDQAKILHYFYEISAGLLAQMSTQSVIFLLLRTLKDALPGTLLTAFYTQRGQRWRCIKVYRGVATAADFFWNEGPHEPPDRDILDSCRQQRAPVMFTDSSEITYLNWAVLKQAGIQQVLYYPLATPTGDFYGVACAVLPYPSPISAQEATIVRTLIQQGAAALARVRLYETSREEESRLRAILESSEDGVLLISGNLEIRYVNQRALELLEMQSTPALWEGRTATEAIGSIREEARDLARWLVHSARGVWAETIPAGESVAVKTFSTRRGRVLTLHQWPVHSQQQQLLGGLFVIRDVTEQKKLEQMRDDLLHMLVHDMRNPLSLIINALQIILDPMMADIAGEAAGLALKNSERLLMLVNAILDIGKLEAGRLELRPGAVNLTQMLSGLKRVIGLARKPVTLEQGIPEGLAPVWADAEVLERVFQNLVDNAIKFIPEQNGLIRVSAKRKDKEVQVEIFNNGPPIPLELQSRLFEKFVTEHPEKVGYGLGLAFCRMAIEAHGGRIWVENIPTGGVAFYFTLPVAQ